VKEKVAIFQFLCGKASGYTLIEDHLQILWNLECLLSTSLIGFVIIKNKLLGI
jgi:hypothetical protein